jgi:hypothetical protein
MAVQMAALPEDDDPAFWRSLPMPRFEDNDDLDDELVGEDLADWELEALAAGDGPEPAGDLCTICGPGQSCPALADDGHDQPGAWDDELAWQFEQDSQSPLQEAQ